MRFAFGRNVATEFCEIFGLDPKQTEHIEISIALDDAVRLTTTRYVTEEESDKLTAIMRRFYLAEIEDKGAPA